MSISSTGCCGFFCNVIYFYFSRVVIVDETILFVLVGDLFSPGVVAVVTL